MDLLFKRDPYLFTGVHDEGNPFVQQFGIDLPNRRIRRRGSRSPRRCLNRSTSNLDSRGQKQLSRKQKGQTLQKGFDFFNSNNDLEYLNLAIMGHLNLDQGTTFWPVQGKC